MAKFTSKRLSRDASYNSSSERAFRKSLRNKRTSSAVKKYLAKRGRKGYSKKSFKKWLRQERMKDYGGAMGKVGEEKFVKYMEEYAKKPESHTDHTPKETTSSPGYTSGYAAEKLKKAAEQRKKRKNAQERRQLREEFNRSSQFSAPTRATREGIGFDPRAGVQGPRAAMGARSAPDFNRQARNLRPRP